MEEIADDDELYRRLIPGSVHPDSTVLPTAYYKDWKPDPAISVNIARLSSPEQTIAQGGRPGFGLGMLIAAVPRQAGLTVRHDPDEAHGNQAHALIEGASAKAHCRILAQATRLLVRPSEKLGPPFESEAQRR